MAFIRKIKGSLVKQDSSLYVGEESYLFYDIETNCLRAYDGTPGGKPVCYEGGDLSGGVEEYPTLGDFPTPGETDIIYIAADTNLIYRWTGTDYQPLVSLGEDDNVQEYTSVSLFPPTGISEVIYIDTSTNLLYRWNGSTYVLISNEHESATVLNIPATETRTVMATLPAGNLSAKYLISILDDADSRFASSEVMTSYKDSDDSVRFSHYSLIGDRIKYKVTVIFNNPNIELLITNNDDNTITATVTRIPSIAV